MENIIELDTPIVTRKPFPWRALCLWSVFLAGGWAFPRAVDEVTTLYSKHEQAFVIAVVERDLQNEPVEVFEEKTKKGVKIQTTHASKETLLKAMWALKSENDKLKGQLTIIKDTLGYTEM